MLKKFYEQEVITHFDFSNVNIGDLVAWEYPKTQSYYEEVEGRDPRVTEVEREFVEKTYAGTRVGIVSHTDQAEDEMIITEVYSLPETAHEDKGVRKTFTPESAESCNLRFIASVEELKDYLLKLDKENDNE